MHICFADDLLMCCRADKISILLMMQAVEHFSSVSGPKANLEKSSFCVAGVTQEFRAQIMQDMHFTIGEMPFKYLGIPLSSRKLSIHQCLPLVEKIITRIQCWTTKFLSYSGRVQLIKSVLFEMQTYWAQVFLLPKKILTMVTNVCRNFLWTGSNEYPRRALIAWSTVCLPKPAGGLNILDFFTWNKAAICKLLWAVDKKKDKLWIQWIHSIYIKVREVNSMPTPSQASWLVRKIFGARKWMTQSGNVMNCLELFEDREKFSIKKAYQSFLPTSPKVSWKSPALVKGIIPRHQFILWLTIHKKLSTVDKIQNGELQ